MPLIPSIRPLAATSKTEPIPINTPPTKEASGVNSFQFIINDIDCFIKIFL